MGSDENLFAGDSAFFKIKDLAWCIFAKPLIWIKENVVDPNRQEYYWYHEKIQRVPTVDECYQDDLLCIYEANQQYYRDKSVDANILNILKMRLDHCAADNMHDQDKFCKEYFDAWQTGLTNYFTKYGDLGVRDCALACYLKQKHRMAWERRHGPVGSGMREPKEQSYYKKKKDSC